MRKIDVALCSHILLWLDPKSAIDVMTNTFGNLIFFYILLLLLLLLFVWNNKLYGLLPELISNSCAMSTKSFLTLAFALNMISLFFFVSFFIFNNPVIVVLQLIFEFILAISNIFEVFHNIFLDRQTIFKTNRTKSIIIFIYISLKTLSMLKTSFKKS